MLRRDVGLLRLLVLLWVSLALCVALLSVLLVLRLLAVLLVLLAVLRVATVLLLLLAVSAAVLVERGLERGCAWGEGGAGVESRRAGSGLLVNVHVLCLLGQVFILPAFGSAVRHACAVRKVLFWEIVEGSSLSSPRREVGGKCGGLIIK